MAEADGSVGEVREPVYWRVRSLLGSRSRSLLRREIDRAAPAWLGSVRGANTETRVGLTLDDGPDPLVTPKILTVLADHEVHATFFVLLTSVRRNLDVAQEVLSRGHEIGLHGIDHRPVRGMSRSEAFHYLERGKAELEDLTESPVSLYRPTFGAQSLATFLAARRAGLEVVVWTTDVADWEDRTHEAVVADGVLTPAGGILLYHDGMEGWIGRPAVRRPLDRPRALSGIIQGWAGRGLRASSVSELLSAGTVRRSVWFRP